MRLRLAFAALGLSVTGCESSDRPAVKADDVTVGSDAGSASDDVMATPSDTLTPDDDDVEVPETDTVTPDDDDAAVPETDTSTPSDDDVETPANDTATPDDTAQPPGPSVTNGETVYTANCGGCHGYAGTQIPGVDLKAKTDAEITAAVRQGVSYMPAFDTTSVSDTALADLIAFIRTF